MKKMDSLIPATYENGKSYLKERDGKKKIHFIESCKINVRSLEEQYDDNSSKLCCYCGCVLRDLDHKIRYINVTESEFVKFKFSKHCHQVLNNRRFN
jgi:hypothetical protein